ENGVPSIKNDFEPSRSVPSLLQSRASLSVGHSLLRNPGSSRAFACANPSPAHRRTPRKDALLLKRAARHLHADRRAGLTETAADTHRRKTGHVERNGAETIGAAALVLTPDFSAVDVQPALLALVNRGSRKADRGNGEELDSLQQGAKLVAD